MIRQLLIYSTVLDGHALRMASVNRRNGRAKVLHIRFVQFSSYSSVGRVAHETAVRRVVLLVHLVSWMVSYKLSLLILFIWVRSHLQVAIPSARVRPVYIVLAPAIRFCELIVNIQILVKIYFWKWFHDVRIVCIVHMFFHVCVPGVVYLHLLVVLALAVFDVGEACLAVEAELSLALAVCLVHFFVDIDQLFAPVVLLGLRSLIRRIWKCLHTDGLHSCHVLRSRLRPWNWRLVTSYAHSSLGRTGSHRPGCSLVIDKVVIELSVGFQNALRSLIHLFAARFYVFGTFWRFISVWNIEAGRYLPSATVLVEIGVVTHGHAIVEHSTDAGARCPLVLCVVVWIVVYTYT